ncbi:MAG: DegV family protein [Oscillospiraceae bacterium]|nr:DegV family protein [Oscillospiraceae bacterium]
MKPKIKLITDSASDIPREIEQEYSIGMFKVHMTIDDFEFDERDISNEEFYERIKNSDNMPTHAQITPFEFAQSFKKYYDEGFTDIIYVSLPKRGSNTNFSANIAKNEFFESHPEAEAGFKIHIIDSGNYTGAYGYPVCQAAKKIAKGASPAEVVAYIQDWADYAEIIFGCYSLEYVKRSARVSAAAAFAGEVLGLRPIIKIKDGISYTLSKVRGTRNIIPKIIEHAQADMTPKSPYCILYGNNPEQADELEREAVKKFGYPPEMRFQIGPAIASNVGPQTIGLTIRSKLMP